MARRLSSASVGAAVARVLSTQNWVLFKIPPAGSYIPCLQAAPCQGNLHVQPRGHERRTLLIIKRGELLVVGISGGPVCDRRWRGEGSPSRAETTQSTAPVSLAQEERPSSPGLICSTSGGATRLPQL